MGLFRNTTTDDGYALLLDDIRKTTADLNCTYTNLENVVDPDLIDYYIYQAKAVQMRYRFLHHQISSYAAQQTADSHEELHTPMSSSCAELLNKLTIAFREKRNYNELRNIL